jgi:UDP-N-acetyl-D-glucosamine dehydrogenase
VVEALNDDAKAVRNSKIAVIGVAYKRDVDDLRESPALDIIQLLEEKGAQVSYHDPYVPTMNLDHGRPDRTMQSVDLTAEWLNAADCVVIVTDHSSYDWRWVVTNSKLILDTRNATARVHSAANGHRIVKL